MKSLSISDRFLIISDLWGFAKIPANIWIFCKKRSRED
jgi:hypothetical protein